MSNTEIETNTQLNLPDEMWSKLFEYLPIDDRKSIRLTCRHFYEVSNCSSLQSSEEMVFYGNINTFAAINSLTSCNRKTWNLKFSSVRLTDDAGMLSFFQSQGANIRSLTFDRCFLARGLMSKIIPNCTNLRSLAISDDPSWGYDHENMIYLFDDFVSLWNDGIILPYVRKFSLKLNHTYTYEPFTNELFLSFFALFPNIEELDFKCPIDSSPIESDAISTEIISSASFSFSCLNHQLLKIRNQVKKLHFDFYVMKELNQPREHLIQNLNEIACIEMKKLKEFHFYWSSELDALNPALPFRHLTDLRFSISKKIVESFSPISGIAFLGLLLKPASAQLRSLALVFSGRINYRLTKDCFQTLVRSQLRSLNLMGDFSIDFELSSLDRDLLPNQTLQHLEFRARDNLESILFTTYFHCLEHIVVDETSPNILSNIFRYQKNLHFLTIGDLYSSVSLKWLRNDKILTRQLDLTHLCVQNCRSIDLSGIFLKFKFPKLKSLTIRYPPFALELASYSFNVNILYLFWQSIQNLTELEYLEIRYGLQITSRELSTLCRTLHKLRYFLYFNSCCDPFEMLQYHQFFQQSPSLRILVHSTSESQSVKYVRDIVLNTVENLPWSQEEDDTEFIYDGIPDKYFAYYIEQLF